MQIITREIVRSGAVSLDEVLQKLPANNFCAQNASAIYSSDAIAEVVTSAMARSDFELGPVVNNVQAPCDEPFARG